MTVLELISVAQLNVPTVALGFSPTLGCVCVWLGVGMCLALFPILEYMFLIKEEDKRIGRKSNFLKNLLFTKRYAS